MSAPEHAPIAWHISSFSADGGGNCVEAGLVNDGTERVAVRHSKDPDGPTIHYTRAEWEAFLAGARAGEFDFHRD
ncbi:DUF397 domain-containing protein [Streptosporangium sp. 'caverna']|uniref:DUF397 domain-containing protein n=1 Tax=Streptosporangium sp. 'caverna' TaxID=2202249 RepID=UPI000D7E9937|nr:DUF397 domain-containing protein [Streptosporangium sp. 'caverna']AWS46133.1 DUF397 domain-containing protein [Streptosporangium sp. 'caverna']